MQQMFGHEDRPWKEWRTLREEKLRDDYDDERETGVTQDVDGKWTTSKSIFNYNPVKRTFVLAVMKLQASDW